MKTLGKIAFGLLMAVSAVLIYSWQSVKTSARTHNHRTEAEIIQIANETLSKSRGYILNPVEEAQMRTAIKNGQAADYLLQLDFEYKQRLAREASLQKRYRD